MAPQRAGMEVLIRTITNHEVRLRLDHSALVRDIKRGLHEHGHHAEFKLFYKVLGACLHRLVAWIHDCTVGRALSCVSPGPWNLLNCRECF